MKIKKFEALTEQEAMAKVKSELGANALILSIKRVPPKGFFGFLKKSNIEVTAAFDETNNAETLKREKKSKAEIEAKHRALIEQQEKYKSLQFKLNSTEEMLRKVKNELTVSQQRVVKDRIYENSMIQFFYDSLIAQEVLPEVAQKLLESVDVIEEENQININLIVKIVYNTIVNILSNSEDLEVQTRSISNTIASPQVLGFVGPTGVGKTTTIAKLSSNFVLKDDLQVGLITADTYRIAAIEQLKTYAEILNINVSVIYNSDELLKSYTDMKNTSDVILIDTAGRSHKNTENLNDLAEIVKAIPTMRVYLVLSLTTKLQDLLGIINTYSKITEFNLIFTKLDETVTYGAILNVCYLTKKKISYLTNGQNVPEDIEPVKPEKVARILLGLGEQGVVHER